MKEVQPVCSSMLTPPEIILVSKEEITVLGQKVRTTADVSRLLAENKIVAVEICPQPGAGYEEIGTAIYGATRSGARIEHVGPIVGE